MTATFHLKADPKLRIVTADEILADLEASGIPEPEPEFMGTKDVADACQVSVERVREWANKGVLPEAFRTPSNFRRFRTADVRALQQELSTATTPPRGSQRVVVAPMSRQPSIPNAGTAAASVAGEYRTAAGVGGGSVANPGLPPAQSFPASGGRGEGKTGAI